MILRRIVSAFVTIFIVMTILFFLLHLVPGGDPVTRICPFCGPEYKAILREQWGLNEPLITQYFLYMKKVVTLDYSPISGIGRGNALYPILYILPFTILLFGTAIILSYIFGTTLGIILLSSKKSGVNISAGLFPVNDTQYRLYI